ncbi:vascular-related protein 1 [Senna tora]|uniref:Vascular-related protein 1 n=1 Tax=Senna tora TaxID=362788 RepID=A0A834WNA0_9FABA|nr:vascular-related protein 1 [Senna tora]
MHHISLCLDMAKSGGGSGEESGWTSYFEDFSNSSCFTLPPPTTLPPSASNNSLLSDAASACNNHLLLPSKLNFKKLTRTKQIISELDDPLEDTASSPVGELLHPSEIIMNSRKMDDQLDASNITPMGKGFRGHYSESEIYYDDDDERNLKGEEDSSSTIACTDLKKRGLCLVPLSMLVNYLR